MTRNKQMMISTLSALALSVSFAASAIQDDENKDQMLMDPMTRAELQCAKLRAEAADGTDEEKAMAEKKCQQAIEYAKEMIKAKEKPEPEEDPGEK